MTVFGGATFRFGKGAAYVSNPNILEDGRVVTTWGNQTSVEGDVPTAVTGLDPSLSRELNLEVGKPEVAQAAPVRKRRGRPIVYTCKTCHEKFTDQVAFGNHLVKEANG